MLTRHTRCLLAALTILQLGPVMAATAAEEDIDASDLLRAGNYSELNSHYAYIQRQFVTGAISGDQLRDAFRAFYPTDTDLGPRFDDWVTAFPKSYVAHVARGIYFRKLGWQERGDRYMSDTSQAKIDGMHNAMTKALNDFAISIKLDPKPFLSYFNTVDIGRQYVSAEESRKVFDAAAKLDPNSLGLHQKYMLALTPRWGGSTQAMRAFYEESRETTMSDASLHELESMVLQEEGREYHARGNLAAAEMAYRQSLALGFCSCGNATKDLNNLLFETRQYTAALTLLDDYLQNKPGDLWALANRGSANMNSGRAREAVKDWKQAAGLGDSYSEIHLGMAYLTGGGSLKPDYQQSVHWLRKAATDGEAEAQNYLLQAEEMAARQP